MKSKKVELIRFNDVVGDLVIETPKTSSSQVLNDSDLKPLATKLEELEELISIKATETTLGRLKVDDVSLKVDSDGKIYATGVPAPIFISDVTNLTYIENTEHTDVELTWDNPSEDSYVKTIGYYSYNDLSNVTLSDIRLNLGLSTYEIVDGTLEEYSLTKTSTQTLYVKLFTLHVVRGREHYTEGVTLHIEGHGSINNLPEVSNLQAIPNPQDSGLNISWNNPSQSSYIRTRGFVSYIDISNVTIETIETLLGNETFEFVNNTSTSKLVAKIPTKATYTKVFTIHNVDGVEQYSNGVTVYNVGDLSPEPVELIPISNLQITPNTVGTNVSLTWDNPKNIEYIKTIGYYSTQDISNDSIASLREKEGSTVTKFVDGIVNITDITTTPFTNYYFRFFTAHNDNHIETYSIGVSGTVYTEDTTPVEDVTSLNVSQNNTGTTLTVTWSNPVNYMYSKTVGFYSRTDIRNVTIDWLLSNEGTSVTRIVNDTSERITLYPVNVNTTYYFKFFTLNIKNNSEVYSSGVSTSILTKDSVPPSTITNFTANVLSDRIRVSWTNPSDSDFNRTVIRYKTTDYPVSATDGTQLYSGSGQSHDMTTGLTNATTYYFRAFTYDNSGNVNTSTTNMRTTAYWEGQLVWSLTINNYDSNPLTTVSYTGNNSSFTPATNPSAGNFNYGSWADKFPFNQIKPFAISHDRTEFIELNPNDFNKTVTGANINISTSGNYNVMIRFPKIYWYMKSNTNRLNQIFISNRKVDSNYRAWAHQMGTTEYEYVYISAFVSGAKDYNGTTVYKSQTGSTGSSHPILTARSYAKANGGTFEVMNFYQWTMIQLLYTFLFKNLNSQQALGQGYVSTSGNYTTRGGSVNKGMIYGDPSSQLTQVKLFGIEDLWHRTPRHVEGYRVGNVTSAPRVANHDYNDESSWETPVNHYLSGNGFIVDINYGQNAFLSQGVSGGSSSTYFCDYVRLNTNSTLMIGGEANNPSYAGMYYHSLTATSSTSTYSYMSFLNNS